MPTVLSPPSLHHPGKFQDLIERVRNRPPLRLAVVYPCTAESLSGAMEVANAGVGNPTLIGPEITIRSLAEQHGISLGKTRIISVGEPGEAARRACGLAVGGEVDALMKGSLHTAELLRVLVARETGLRTGRRVSHVFLLDVPSYSKLLQVTDAVVNVQPDLATKRDIVQNAVNLARSLGLVTPKVAVLSALEVVSPLFPASLDAAALCKMAERGQIEGAMVDGPLAFDDAISADAARVKGIASAIAGDPDILLVSGVEVGNALVKQLQYLSGATAAGLLLGARVPVVLTSRADNARTRFISTVVAAATGLR